MGELGDATSRGACCPSCGASLAPAGEDGREPSLDRAGSSAAPVPGQGVASASVEAREEDSEVSEAMVLAGASILVEFDREYDDDSEIARAVYLAMRRTQKDDGS